MLVVQDELDVPKALYLLCMLKAVEGGLCLLEVLEVLRCLKCWRCRR